MNIFEFIIHITVFIDRFIIPLLFAIAFLVFIFGVYNYFIVGGGDKEKRQEGRNYILWGVIALVVMIAVWGIVTLLINSLGFDVRNRPPLPSFGSPAGYGQPQGGSFQTPGGNVSNLPNGASCGNGTQCASGNCVAGKCTVGGSQTQLPNNSQCTGSSQCKSGYCAGGVCKDRSGVTTGTREFGQSCTTGDQCKSGNCLTGKCGN